MKENRYVTALALLTALNIFMEYMNFMKNWPARKFVLKELFIRFETARKNIE